VSIYVRAFVCAVCGAQVAFENVKCLNCAASLAFSVSAGRVVPLSTAADGRREYRGTDRPVERPCRNEKIAACNWLAPEDAANGLCLSCRLTRTRPDDNEVDARPAFVRAEAAKRRLVYQLLDLGLPVRPWMDDPADGLAVDLLSSRDRSVVTGHADGVITLDLAEGDDPHREAIRVKLSEDYRTLLGHLRHESGHYYWDRLTAGPGQLDAFRALFGDERADYQQEIKRHYDEGPPAGWEQNYVSAYATMHPWEDWAETFAHYLHLRDLLQTAHSYGLAVRPQGPGLAGPQGNLDIFDDLDALGQQAGIGALVNRWLPLSYALNAVNRSIGKPDLYPFVLTPSVISKLDAVHAAVRRTVTGSAGPTGSGEATPPAPEAWAGSAPRARPAEG
jgi:hypothetical protein